MTNPSSASAPLKFQALFHTYFRLPEGVTPSDVVISDTLTGLKYLDKTQNYMEKTQEDKDFSFVGETDMQWFGVPKSYAAKYGESGQGLKIETDKLGELRTHIAYLSKGHFSPCAWKLAQNKWIACVWHRRPRHLEPSLGEVRDDERHAGGRVEEVRLSRAWTHQGLRQPPAWRDMDG